MCDCGHCVECARRRALHTAALLRSPEQAARNATRDDRLRELDKLIARDDRNDYKRKLYANDPKRRNQPEPGAPNAGKYKPRGPYRRGEHTGEHAGTGRAGRAGRAPRSASEPSILERPT